MAGCPRSEAMSLLRAVPEQTHLGGLWTVGSTGRTSAGLCPSLSHVTRILSGIHCEVSSVLTAACAVSPRSRAPQRSRYKFLNINCCLLAAQELQSTGWVSLPFCSGAVHAKCWLFLHAVKEEGSVTSCPGCLHCVWGRLGGQNRSPSCCCFSPLTTRSKIWGHGGAERPQRSANSHSASLQEEPGPR